MEKKGPLVGIKILDWTQWQMGTVASAMLADMGADVIHIEHYITGDPGRGLTTLDFADLPEGKTSYFEVNNRGKKSITLNLQKTEGREVLYRLVEKADVFIHNYRPGIPEKLRVDYETLRSHNPMLIYAAASGFGAKGPEAADGALDLVGMARSGISTLLGNEDSPGIPHYGGLGDQAGAIMMAYGVMAALLARERFGMGQKVDSSMLMSVISWEGLMLGKGFYLNKPTVQQDRISARNPLWNYYKCKDGKWTVLAMLQSQRYWPDVCKALGITHVINDPRFKDANLREQNARELISVLDAAFISKTAGEWSAIFKNGFDIISAPVQSMNDLASDPQVIANEYVIDYRHEVLGPVKVVGLPVSLSETPGRVNAEAPEFGQHTEEVLIEMGGYTWDEITELRKKEAI
ncbi:MAG: CoA transferase [Dehalococcoidales bacterium]|nr:CoA transferase [Dehalococcoidales bacterium]